VSRLCGTKAHNFVDLPVSLSHNSLAMKNVLIACLVLLCSCIPALCQQQLDAATKEDVKRLLELTGARARVQQVQQAFDQQMVTSVTDVYRFKHPNATPLELRKVAENTRQYMQDSNKAVSIDEMMDAIVPIYQRHLTHADVGSIINFYNSSAGQKLLKEQPAIMAESMQAAQALAQKHLPEIVAAAERAAEKNTKPASSSTGKPNQPPATPPPPAVFILTSGEKLESSNYLLSATSLRVQQGDRQRTIPLSALNLDATIAANHARGIDLKVPPKGQIELAF
jgi:hypothetical protein